MARHRLPSSSALWQEHETLYVGVFIMALRRLSENRCDATGEDDISEQLCPLLSDICFEEGAKCNGEIRTPDWDKPIQPVNKNELKGGKRRNALISPANLLTPLLTARMIMKYLFTLNASSWVLLPVVNGF